jgi:choline kinase
MINKRAIILAAGEGKRLLGNSSPKCLLKINNETILKRLLKQLLLFEIYDITIVVGYNKEDILNEINLLNIKKYIKIIENEKYKEDINILSLERGIDNIIKSFYLIEADCVFKNKCFELVTDNKYRDKSVWCSIGNFQKNQTGGIIREVDSKVEDIKIVKKYEDSYKKYKKMIGLLKVGEQEINLYHEYLAEACKKSIKQYYHVPWIQNIVNLNSYLCKFKYDDAFSFNTRQEYEKMKKEIENEIN